MFSFSGNNEFLHVIRGNDQAAVFPGRGAGEFTEVADELRLIIVAVVGGQIAQRNRVVPVQMIDGALKANDLCKRLGAYTGICFEDFINVA